MANSVLNYIINVMKKGNGDKQTVTALNSVKSVMTGVGVAVGVATTAYVAFDKIIGESSRKTVKYADEVRKLSSVTKQNAVETSKLIQVADDYKVTSEQLLVATKRLATQGYGMSIDTLAKLSDQYKSLNTAQERQQFLTKNFGKTGQDYITLLEAGSDALLRQADAVNKNLILTEQQVRDARELEIAQDDLNDAMEGYQLLIGTKVVPIQAKLTKQFTEGMGAVLGWGDQVRTIAELMTQQGNPALAGWGVLLQKIYGEQANVNDAISEADIIAQRYGTSTIPTLKESIEDLNDAMKSTKDGGAEMAAGMIQASLAADGALDEEDIQKLLDFRLEMGLLTQEEYNAALEAMKLKDAIEGLPAEKQIDISVYYHTYGFLPGQLLSNNAPKSMTIYAEGGEKTTPYKPAPGVEKTYGNKQAKGGYPSGFTMVGEHGPEIIGPDGYIHSNAESRRMIAAGITPFRSMATGGAVFSEPGDVFNPVVTSTPSTLSGAALISSIGASIPHGSSLSSSSVSSPAAASAQAAQASAQASQNMVNVSAQSAEMQAASNERLIDELKALRRDILTGFRDSVQQIVTV